MPLAQIPHEAGSRLIQFLVAWNLAVLRVARDPRPLLEIGGDSRIAPAVPVGADLAVAIEVVE